MAGNSSQDGRSVAQKIVAIMRSFTNSEELSNAEVARSAGLSVSTAHRLLRELVVGGMLERTRHRHYRVGPAIRALVASAPTPAGHNVRAGP